MPPEESPFERSIPPKNSSGPIVGTIIIVLLLIFGALYFGGQYLNSQPEELPLIPEESPAE